MELTQTKKLSEAGLQPRKTFSYETLTLQPNASETFLMELGPSAIVIKLQVDKPSLVVVYGDPSYDESTDLNPYTFRATSDHLIDDGSTLFMDGTVLKTRQYSIFVNLEDPRKPYLYGQITNNGADPTKIKLDLTYLTIEEM